MYIALPLRCQKQYDNYISLEPFMIILAWIDVDDYLNLNSQSVEEFQNNNQGRIEDFQIEEAQKDYYHAAHSQREVTGSRALKRALEALGLFHALSCYLSLIFNHSSTK